MGKKEQVVRDRSPFYLILNKTEREQASTPTHRGRRKDVEAYSQRRERNEDPEPVHNNRIHRATNSFLQSGQKLYTTDIDDPVPPGSPTVAGTDHTEIIPKQPKRNPIPQKENETTKAQSMQDTQSHAEQDKN